MKRSDITFMEGFFGAPTGHKTDTVRVFDWDAAAVLIKNRFIEHNDLRVEAGLQGDWNWTGGVIFEDSKPTNEQITYLSSNWAIPTLILEWDGEEQEEVECFVIKTENTRFHSDSKWDEKSLNILGITLND